MSETMTNPAEIVRALRVHGVDYLTYKIDGEFAHAVVEAADLLESLQSQLAASQRRERAAVEDIRRMLQTHLDERHLCEFCSMSDGEMYPKCKWVNVAQCLYADWRGPTGAGEGEIAGLREAGARIEGCETCANRDTNSYRFYAYPCSECKHRARDSYVPLPAPEAPHE